jgi:hypothetical protein
VLLEKGLVYGDASSIKWWLIAVLDGLGYKRVLQIIRAHLDKAPLCVEKTLYWLPGMYKAQSEELKAEVCALQKEFEQKYPDYQPQRSVGTHG